MLISSVTLEVHKVYICVRDYAPCMSVHLSTLCENEEQVLDIMAVLISHNNTEAVMFCIPTFITCAAGRPLEARPGQGYHLAEVKRRVKGGQ